MSAEERQNFPEDFLFGTATAAYQIEGAVAEAGRGRSIWDTYSHEAGSTRNGDTGDIACDHYHRLTEDLELLAELGAGAYRFSVAWPRIQPSGKGPANPDGLDFYERLVDGLLERGIQPALTLYHWDLPQPLEDAGGWPERDTALCFSEYAAIVGEALGDRVPMWITLNEPWCSAFAGYGAGEHAPGGRDVGRAVAATHHLLLGHGYAVQSLRSLLPSEAKIGITLNPAPVRPATDHPADAEAARRVDGNLNRIFLEPLFCGQYPKDMVEHYEGKEPGLVVEPGDLEAISAPLDFLGVNYYHPRIVIDAGRVAEADAAGYWVPPATDDPVTADLGARGVQRPEYRRTEMGWEVEPGGLTELLVRLRDDYVPIPMYVTENGAACNDYVGPDGKINDPERIAYLEGHLRAVADAREAGVDVAGYFVWSFLDNFEWAHGYSRRFGLVWIDYPTGTRLKKRSFSFYSALTRSRSLDQAVASAELDS